MKKIVFLIFIVLLTGCEKDYICLNGYDLNDETNICTRVVEEEASLKYYCSDKTNELIDGKCKKTELSSAKIEKKCNSGFSLEGTVCIKDGTVLNYMKCGANRTYSSKTNECYDKISAISIYKCDQGKLDKTSCVKITLTDALSKYTCPETYELNDKTCTKTIIMDAVKVKNN